MRTSPRLVSESPRHVRNVGFAITIGLLSEQMWWTKTFLGLRCNLTRLPRVRKARVPVTMEPTSTSLFRGFDKEIAQSRGTSYVELLLRRGLCDSGVQELYVAYHDGQPAYAQWLIRADDQDRLHEHSPGRYDLLEPHEVLLEGAFTFAAFRRMGVMADGWHSCSASRRGRERRRRSPTSRSTTCPRSTLPRTSASISITFA